MYVCLSVYLSNGWHCKEEQRTYTFSSHSFFYILCNNSLCVAQSIDDLLQTTSSDASQVCLAFFNDYSKCLMQLGKLGPLKKKINK